MSCLPTLARTSKHCTRAPALVGRCSCETQFKVGKNCSILSALMAILANPFLLLTPDHFQAHMHSRLLVSIDTCRREFRHIWIHVAIVECRRKCPSRMEVERLDLRGYGLTRTMLAIRRRAGVIYHAHFAKIL